MPTATFRYAVTLEFTEDAPLTVRGKLEVPNARLGARRAVEAAFRAHPGRRWSSLSILLERASGDGWPDVLEGARLTEGPLGQQ